MRIDHLRARLSSAVVKLKKSIFINLHISMKCSLRSMCMCVFFSQNQIRTIQWWERMLYSLSGDHEGNTEEENNGYVVFKWSIYSRISLEIGWWSLDADCPLPQGATKAGSLHLTGIGERYSQRIWIIRLAAPLRVDVSSPYKRNAELTELAP